MSLIWNPPRACLLLFLFGWAANVFGNIAAEVFDVRNFGAVANSKTDSTQAFMNAWKEACAMDGMPRFLIPEGSFFIGPLAFVGPCKGPMVMQIKGALIAPTDLNMFSSDHWVSFEHIDGLMITGGGKFDGKGASAWPHNQCPNQKNCKLLPTSVKFSFVTNATIRDISSVDSKFFHMIIYGSKDINLHNIKITAPGDSPNTDGIHIGSSSNIKITNSVIGTGDDCVSIGPGSVNVSVTKVFCGPGHGISVGSLGKYPDEEDVHGLMVRNCTITDTLNGVRIKTWQASPTSSASNFMFEDIVMNNVNNPIIIDQEYCPYSSCDDKSPSMVKISDVKFHNIRGVSASKVAVNLLCSQAVPCQGVELKDINLEYVGHGSETASTSCSNVKGTSMGFVIPPSCI